MNERIKEIVSKIKSPKFLVMAGIIGMLLIFLSSLGTGEKPKETETAAEFSADAYRLSLEEQIKDMVTDITGSKAVNVIVTLESGISYSYADTREETTAEETRDNAESSDIQIKEGYITVKNADGGEEALLVTAKMPQIRGVAIVCEGGDSEIINEKITNTVTAALDITSKRVYICGRKQR